MEERGIGENGGRRVGRKKGCLIRYYMHEWRQIIEE